MASRACMPVSFQSQMQQVIDGCHRMTMHNTRGAALEGLGRQREALDAFKEATRLDPSNTELSEIVAEIKQSLEQNPEPSGTVQYGAPQLASQVQQPVPQSQPDLLTAPPREVSPVVNNLVPNLSLNTAKPSPSATSSRQGSRRPSDTVQKRAGVGMHIVLDDSHPNVPPRVLLMQLAPWSPLQGQANVGDIVVALDGVRTETLSFEKVSNLILGPVSSPITLSFVRPTAYPVREWDVTVERVFPSDLRATPSPAPRVMPHSHQQHALRASAPVLPSPDVGMSPPSELRSPQQRQYRAQVESVLSSVPVFMTLTLDEDYHKVTSSANTVQYFKNKLRIDLASALQVAPARFVIGGLAPGSVLAGLKILPSASGGGGVPGVEPLTPAEIAADLKAQSVDLRSALRRAVPTLTHAAVAESPLTAGTPNGGTAGSAESIAGADPADILRNFSEELQLLALFCRAPASDANLASFSKQGSKLKPKHVLRTYQAVHELKRELAKSQDEVGRLQAEVNTTTQGLVRDAEVQKITEEAERLQKGLEIRDRAITTYKEELTSVKQQLARIEKQKEDAEDKMKVQRELVVRQEDQIASLRRGIAPDAAPPAPSAEPPAASDKAEEQLRLRSVEERAEAKQRELEAAVKQRDAQIAVKEREVSELAGKLSAVQGMQPQPQLLPSIALTNGNVYGKDELKHMVPNYEWDTFFSELLKIKANPSATITSSPNITASPNFTAAAGVGVLPPPGAPSVSPSQSGVPLDPGEPPLPDGWSKDIYEGKALYVNHSTRSFSWIHPAKVAPQQGGGVVPPSSLQT